MHKRQNLQICKLEICIINAARQKKLESQKKICTAEETNSLLDDVSVANSKGSRKRWEK